MPSIVSSSLFKFADDTELYRTISNSSDILSLQNDLDLYILIGSLVLINISKCKTMHIARFNSDSYTYFMNNQPLPTVDLENDLGVFIDNQLKFYHHTGATYHCQSKSC